ncbi:MAG: hypothetical protein LBR27_11135, partial [Bifidobacteriaceae bacterium]|nr:hypothetical protein [Bifidobacteriaceae bacterium]
MRQAHRRIVAIALSLAFAAGGSLTASSHNAAEAAGGSWIIDNSVGTRILPDYGAGWCSNGTTYSGDSPTQKQSCETAGSTWVYSLTDNSAGSFNRTYAMVTDPVCWVTAGPETFSLDGVSQAGCAGLTTNWHGTTSAPQCDITVGTLTVARAIQQPACAAVSTRWGQPANFVAHDFTYQVKDAAGNNVITTATKTGTAGATDLLSGATVDSTYYEPVWQGWTTCSDGSNVYNTACPDGQAPAYYYRGGGASGLLTLPRYDGMIYGFAGAEIAGQIEADVNTHDTESGTNSLVQPLAINVDQPSSYTTAASVLGASTTVSTQNGLDTVATSEVDKSITVLITPQATTAGRYTTAFYTQDWMYWGSEARDQSNASAAKWTTDDPLTNPENPTFQASQLVTETNPDGSTAVAALYGTASDNDGLIWLGGLGRGGANTPYYLANTNQATRAYALNSACANTYYVADDVKLRFAYPAGKEQEPVEHYYYPIALYQDTGQPLYSTGSNDGAGVYDYNCGLSLYGDQSDNSGAMAPWDQPFVRTVGTAAGDGWTYDRAAATTDVSDRAKESNLHPGDQLPTTQVGFISNGEDSGTLPGASAASVGEADTSTTGWRDNVGADIVPDPSVAVLVDSLGRAPADPYDDPQYW